MNKLRKYLLAMLVAVFAASSCTDFVDPAIPYNGFETGVYLRTLETKSNTFNYFDLANASFGIVVEVVDEDGGKLLQDVDVLVRHRRGQTLSNEVSIRKITASEFKPAPYPNRNFPPAPERSFPWNEITVTATETLSKLGMTIDDVDGGDFFEFRLELHDTKGRTFTNSNQSGDVGGGAYYASPFFYRVAVVCPSELAGTFAAQTVGAGPWGCTSEWTGTVKWVHEGNGVYNIIAVDANGTDQVDFSMGAYWVCYGATATLPGGDLKIADACGKLRYTGQSRWGETYTFNNLTVNGKTLTIDWVNDYGEGGVTTLTRTDKDWPNLKF
jgi:hypothetical protein